jgi:hypothetical protein
MTSCLRPNRHTKSELAYSIKMATIAREDRAMVGRLFNTLSSYQESVISTEAKCSGETSVFCFTSTELWGYIDTNPLRARRAFARL